MGLPKVKQPIVTTTVPSTKTKVRYRPYTMKEETILLMAKESKNPDDMARAVKQVIQNCLIDEVDVDKLSSFDIEHMMIRVRESSVGERLSLQLPVVKCNRDRCPCMINAEVDLRQVVLDRDPPKLPRIDINEISYLTLKYPTLEALHESATITDPYRRVLTLLARCIHDIYEGDRRLIHNQDYFDDDILAWVETFTADQFEKIGTFFENLPRIRHTIEFQCPVCKERKETVPVEGFEPFFF